MVWRVRLGVPERGVGGPGQAHTTLAVNSPPLSGLMWSGGPRSTNRSVSARSTSSKVNRRATTMSRHSRVYLSTTVSMPGDARGLVFSFSLRRSASQLSGSACRTSAPPRPASAARSRAPVPSSAAPSRPSVHHSRPASDRNSPPRPRAHDRPRPPSCPATTHLGLPQHADDLFRRQTLPRHPDLLQEANSPIIPESSSGAQVTDGLTAAITIPLRRA